MLGSIPAVGNVRNAAKKVVKSSKKKAKSTAKKVSKAVVKDSKKIMKKATLGARAIGEFTKNGFNGKEVASAGASILLGGVFKGG